METEKIIIEQQAALIENGLASFQFDGHRVTGEDKTDVIRFPACRNTTFRGVRKAWRALQAQWTDETTMAEGMEIIARCGIQIRRYDLIG